MAVHLDIQGSKEMIKRRRLGDLYVRGKEISIDDGTDDPVVVWLQKLNEVDREAVYRRSQAAKARFLIDADDEDSDSFKSMYAGIRDYNDREGLIRIVTGEEIVKFRIRTESQVAENKESWGKDGFLQGLVDSWVGTDEEPGLARTIVEDPKDPEALRVQAELDRFESEVRDIMDAEFDRLRSEWVEATDESLWTKASHEMLKRRADEVFMAENERQALFFCVRELDDHRVRYFSSPSEIDDLADSVRLRLTGELDTLVVTAHEGKGSPETQDSSASSESPASTDETSGREAVTA